MQANCELLFRTKVFSNQYLSALRITTQLSKRQTMKTRTRRRKRRLISKYLSLR